MKIYSKKTFNVTFAVFVLTLFSMLSFGFQKVSATSPPPLEPGCYTRLSETQNLYSPVTCPDEGRARAVSQFNACYVGLEERDCQDPSLSGSNTPTPGSFSGDNSFSSDNGSTGRSELSQGQCENGLNREDCGIIDVIVTVINFMSALAGIAIVGAIMYAGYLYMTARDNASQIQQAKTRIVWALTALLVFIFMVALLNFLIPGGVL